MMDRSTTSRIVLLAGLVSMSLPACRPEADGSLADVIFSADEAFNTRTQELGVAGWTDAFAPDGRLIVGGGEIVGKTAIRELMGPYLENVRLEWRPSRAVAREGSDLGYTVGRYRAVLRDNPDSIVNTGTYVTIWERQASGEWKVSLDIGSPDPQPESPDAR